MADKIINCWLCHKPATVSEDTLAVVCASCAVTPSGPSWRAVKTEVLAEHPPREKPQPGESTQDRNERIWRAIKDASCG